MTEHRDPIGDEGRLPARDVLAHVDLGAPDEFRGPGPRPRWVRESGLRFGTPLVCPMDLEELPPWLRARARAGPHRYLGLIFTFDLDELPANHYYAAVDCSVELTGDKVIAVAIELDGEVKKLTDRLVPPAAPVPGWLSARLRRRVPRRVAAICGLRTGRFGCAYRDEAGDLLTSRSYTMLAIVEAPSEVTELAGGLSAKTEIARTIFGYVSRRSAATAAPTPFSVCVPATTAPDSAPHVAPHVAPDAGQIVRSRPAAKVEWRIGFTVDIVRYSRRTQPEQEDAQRRLVHVIEESLAAAGLPLNIDDTQDAGDAMHVFLPADVDIRRVSLLVPVTADRLARDNEKNADRMRWRMAIDGGPVGKAEAGFSGHAIISYCRLVESGTLRRAVDDHPEADLALLVSDQIYKAIMRQDYPGGPAAADFRPVRVTIKEYEDDAWLWVAPGGVRR
jgi:hypothetical protein